MTPLELLAVGVIVVVVVWCGSISAAARDGQKHFPGAVRDLVVVLTLTLVGLIWALGIKEAAK